MSWGYRGCIILLIMVMWVSLFAEGGHCCGRYKGVSHEERVRDEWLGRDKAMHLITSMAIVGIGYYTAYYWAGEGHSCSTAVGIGVSLCAGIGREIWDGTMKTPRHFSYKDLVWDAIGIGLGVLIFTVYSSGGAR